MLAHFSSTLLQLSYEPTFSFSQDRHITVVLLFGNIPWRMVSVQVQAMLYVSSF